ncbi:fused phosphoribosylaminoimidazole carboxy formyl formyltransferase; inosine-monophosphate cyclohydrolase [[Clostridium] ultunense Esp]|uniref:Bifunctional purine biosynthesis protein PurH n=1 Tax=[Clostridium] ultunense Esp TaxID=1288971 RepID=M1YZB4_9FIRM|nr:bifunctional phosphoribosylaminoimidazolecarboxamide formyltransferase/IMP cyclohydrolase [Schnuerera ultunensis]CCQ95930.1 fused phosphoribosylaminoimidazole carboxy formyl formyltransferase; inosine-monophosphate cyclohydrolase [[Clostridium] ultunense Esp]SHD76822.1 fused phosphoribosylaminoimidazole carboxy formyl formyltransferase; inosine-monophosphate cyclohydrolase [[Clostridium] ultunense Esp]
MKRALISVYDKKGVIEFSKELIALGWEIISTGGTSKVLKEAGIDIIDIEEITKFPEILDGRVKTLHPNIHGGLLYKREDEEHIKTLENLNIHSIDMVVNNLYPFEETVKKEGVGHDEIMENIDIGGPSMIRAAAKNYKYVTVVTDPSDYSKVLEELKSEGDTSMELRRALARKVFQYTAYYDSLIAKYFNSLDSIEFPEFITLSFKDKDSLRYGENPHQKAAFYREINDLEGTIAGAIQLHGKELSFNNINDGNGTLEILKEFDEPTVVAVKHANPCGIGSGENLLEAYNKAYESDKISIFGGIIGANREIDEEVAKRINDIFIEIVMAPSYTEKALEILTSKKNIRILQIPNIMRKEYPFLDIKKVLGGILIQERDIRFLGEELKVVTDRKPTEAEMEDLLFGWKAVKGVKSNGVLLVKDKGTIGIGMGEVNRVWAVKAAIERAGEKVKGSVLASDGFFPFKDSVEALAKAGVTAIIQPGGSLRDKESIEEANRNGIAMVFTGMRHFKH